MLTEIEINDLVRKSFLLFEKQYDIKISVEEKVRIIETYYKLNFEKQWSKQKIVASIVKCPMILYTVTQYIQNSNITINELSTLLNISPSKIKRYFTDDILSYILSDEQYDKFIKMKEQKKKMGNLKGGMNYSQCYQAIRNSDGTFNGSFAKIDENIQEEIIGNKKL